MFQAQDSNPSPVLWVKVSDLGFCFFFTLEQFGHISLLFIDVVVVVVVFVVVVVVVAVVALCNFHPCLC